MSVFEIVLGFKEVAMRQERLEAREQSKPPTNEREHVSKQPFFGQFYNISICKSMLNDKREYRLDIR